MRSMRRFKRLALLALAASLSAQSNPALETVKRNEPHFIDEQIRICEIPAPPFHEEARGRELERLFRQQGLKDVRIDKAGNVIGVRPGASAHPNSPPRSLRAS